MTKESNTVEEVWTYAGRRETSGGKIADAWEDPNGDVLLYSKLKGHYFIGQRYTARVERDGDNTTLHGRPEMLANEMADQQQRQEWTAQSRMVEGRIAMQRKLEKQGDELRQACEPLRAMLFEARTRPERAALIAAILLEIGAS